MSQVTRKMFFEEYARQLIELHGTNFRDMDTLSDMLVSLNSALDSENMDKEMYKFVRGPALIAACMKFGFAKPTTHYLDPSVMKALRKLPKE